LRLTQSIILLSMCLMAISPAAAQEYRNWFNDPFFQISSADPTCPEPAGPFVDEISKRTQSHHRAEKGTTCWLAGQCDRPKAYLYDADIAKAIQKDLRQTTQLKNTTLWITVQSRVVYIEGCARDRATVDRLETRIRAIQYVQQTSRHVRIDIKGQPPAKLPYAVRIKS
jgi:hypothetical protein